MLLNRFLKYVKIDTQSDENSSSTPSTEKQLNLLKLLQKELEEMGVKCELDEYGRVYGWLDGNESYPRIGLCAHVDTASEASGKDVNPTVIERYNGGDIQLGNSGLFLRPTEFKKLSECINKTLIVTDGTTLLGGDDKCGLAIIMETIKKYQQIPVKDRHPMSVLFTPDEEIGRGPEHFDVKKYGAKFGYTVDGDDPRKVSIENFNAKSCSVQITGKSIHPGDAKGVMINASLVLNTFLCYLPKNKIPAKTSGRQGFIHVTELSGEVEKASAHLILREHDKNKLEKLVDAVAIAKYKACQKHPGAIIDVEIKDSYRNMIEVINEQSECKNHLEKVYQKMGLPLEYDPIRGGTDGATFSFEGCPSPNLGTGSYNHHGRYEFAVLEEMELLVDICTEIFKI